MQLVRRLWTEEDVTSPASTSRSPGRPSRPAGGTRRPRHPRLYFGGASEAAERVAATEADVQLFWGEPLEGVRERIARAPAARAGARPRARAAGVRAADHDPRARHHRAGLGGRRGEGRGDGPGADASSAVQPRLQGGRPAAPPRPRRAGRRARQQPLHRPRPVRRRRRRHDVAGRLGRGRRQVPPPVPGARITHFVLSDTPYLREIGARATSSCPCSGPDGQPPDPGGRAVRPPRGPRPPTHPDAVAGSRPGSPR